MNRFLTALLTVAALGLAAGSARAQYASTAPRTYYYYPQAAYSPGVYTYSNGYYYYTPRATYSYAAPTYAAPAARTSSTNGAMTGRVSPSFDPTGRGVQLHKPWLQPLR